MNLRTVRIVILLLAAGAVFLANLARGAENRTQACSQSNDRCITIKFCAPYAGRFRAGEYQTNADFPAEVLKLACDPEGSTTAVAASMHICCPKKDIQCRWEGQLGACTRPERCFGSGTNALSTTNTSNLCYVHNNKEFFCCSNPICAIHKTLCDDDEDSSGWKPIPTAFLSCNGATGDPGTSIPRYLCPDGKDISQLIDPRASFARTITTSACCKREEVTQQLIAHPKAALLARLNCGDPGSSYKLQGGWYTEPGEFPWMVVLLSARGVFCTGTLVHPRYVLTTASCLRRHPDTLQMTVRLGIHDALQRPKVCRKVNATCLTRVQEIAVEEKILHDLHDVGLLKLRQPVRLVSGTVQPICLPIFDYLRTRLPIRLLITGWGMLYHDRHPYSLMLKAYAKVRPPTQTEEDGCHIDHAFCVEASGDSNHCAEDAGGPYQTLDMYNETIRFVQFGILSSNDQACTGVNRTTSRNLLVGYFVDWILDNMELP